MTHPDDIPSDAGGRVINVPRFPSDFDSAMLRDFVRVAIDEGLVIPVAITPERVVILLPDPAPAGPILKDLPQLPQGGRADDPPPIPGPARSYDSIAWCTFRATDHHAASLQHFIAMAAALEIIDQVASPTGPPLMLDPRLRPEAWAANAGDPWTL